MKYEEYNMARTEAIVFAGTQKPTGVTISMRCYKPII